MRFRDDDDRHAKAKTEKQPEKTTEAQASAASVKSRLDMLKRMQGGSSDDGDQPNGLNSNEEIDVEGLSEEQV